MSIPGYKDWIKETSAFGKPRGKALQELDKVIQEYEAKPDDAHRIRVWSFLNYWKRQNKDWKTSVRNRAGAVDRLDKELANISPMGMLRPEEKEAMKFVMEQRKLTFAKLFKNKQVTFKVANFVAELKHDASDLKQKCSAAGESLKSHENAAAQLSMKWQNNPMYVPGHTSFGQLHGSAWQDNPLFEPSQAIVKPSRTTADGYYPTPGKPSGKTTIDVSGYGMTPDGKGMGKQDFSRTKPEQIRQWLQQKVEEGVKKLFEVDRLENLGPLTNLILTIVQEVVVGLTPLLGHVKDGVGMVAGWIEVGVGYYKKCSISERRYVIEEGDPDAAFRALLKILQDELANSAAEASMATASFAIKTGLAFTDFGLATGPIVGAVKAVAQIIHKVTLLAIEFRATINVNKALESGILDIRLFETYPLMGCYMLVCADLSDMIPIGNFGMPGWMDVIERLKKHGYDDIYKRAEELIQKSPWEIKGMPKRKTGTSFTDALPGGGVLGALGGGGELGGMGFEFAELKDVPEQIKKVTGG